jgi:glycosyltransferase involved in cell wall biosynthesis
MKILFYDKSTIYSGAEKSLILLANGVYKDYDCQILFNYPLEHHKNYTGLKKIYRFSKLQFWMGSEFSPHNLSGTDFLKRIFFAIQLIFILKKVKPDIFHINLYRDTDWLDLKIVKFCKVKSVVHVRSLLSQVNITCNQIRDTNLIITTSEFVKREVLSIRYDLNVVSIYDPVDFDYSKKAILHSTFKFRKSLNIKNDILILSSVGILDPRKGHDTAIESAAILFNNKVDFVLLIVGGDLLKNKKEYLRLQELTITYSIEKYVKFLGHVSDIDLVYLISDFILALSKDGEAFGRVPLEAAKHQKVVIGTNCGATPEIIIDKKTGYLVNSNDSKSVANIILQYKTDRKTLGQIGLNAFNRSGVKFSPDVHCSNVVLTYKKLLNN